MIHISYCTNNRCFDIIFQSSFLPTPNDILLETIFTFSQPMCSGMVDANISVELENLLGMLDLFDVTILGLLLFITLFLMICVKIGRHKMSLKPQKKSLIQPPRNLESFVLNISLMILVGISLLIYNLYLKK